MASSTKSPDAAAPMQPTASRPAAAPGRPASVLPRATLVLGGARSGKSAYGEQLLAPAPFAAAPRPVYIATAEAGDEEMAERIRRHRARRGAAWQTVEEPLRLSDVLAGHAGRAVLVDCLTLWLSNLLLSGRDVAAERDRFVAAVARFDGPLVLIANEVGLGIVPDNALARRFRDEAGWLNQALARVCSRVVFMAAGLPMVMKDDGMAAPAVMR